MTREQAREEINNRLTVELTKAPKRISGYDTYICPFCGNGSGKDGTGISTKDGIHYKCFKCDFWGDYLEYLKKLHNENETEIFGRYNLTIDNGQTRPSATTEQKQPEISKSERLQTLATPEQSQRIASDSVDYTQYYKERNAQAGLTEYFTFRGISSETVNRFMLGYDPEWRHPKVPATVPTTARVIIPTSKYTYVARDTDPNATQYKKQKVGGSPLFNAEALTGTESSFVFIVEGEFDALSVIDVGGQAVALSGTGGKNKLLEAVKHVTPTATLVLAIDNDEAGQKVQAEIKKELETLKIPFIEVNISGKHKDPNEHLQKDRETFSAFIKDPQNTERDQRKGEYMKTNAAVNCLDAFMEGIKKSANTPATPTGFPLLDEVLDDGLFEGLYILGAISSIGKTSFCLQIADQIARQKNDVIIFSLEMSRYELISKSLSRLTIMADKGRKENDCYYARSSREITAGSKWKNYSQRETTLITNAINTYGNEYARNLYIHESLKRMGIEDISRTIKEHISFTGNKPFVLIDYLQIIAPFEPRATDKFNTDTAVTELKILSKECKIPILAISSFNRDNYLSPVNMASFKESGAIEYSSDVLFGLQFEGMDNMSEYEGTDERRKNAGKAEMLEKIEEWKSAEPRKIQLKILKNRSGTTGASIYYDYYPMFNWFRESTERKGMKKKKGGIK
ncbi:MAG: toprim domain-containing protein [Bacteroidales bacterium]|nr:toprim domain-containing protein [Bacteroidales bacterium]